MKRFWLYIIFSVATLGAIPEVFGYQKGYERVKNSNKGVDIKYSPKIRQKIISDPKDHGFPTSFDNEILNVKPVKVRGGSMEYALKGTRNGKEVIYNILVKDGEIVHRDWVLPKEWIRRSKNFGWPIDLTDIPKR